MTRWVECNCRLWVVTQFRLVTPSQEEYHEHESESTGHIIVCPCILPFQGYRPSLIAHKFRLWITINREREREREREIGEQQEQTGLMEWLNSDVGYVISFLFCCVGYECCEIKLGFELDVFCRSVLSSADTHSFRWLTCRLRLQCERLTVIEC